MASVSQKEYARHRGRRRLPGKTPHAIQKAIAGGRIPVDENGLIDPAVADRAWEANTSAGHRRTVEDSESPQSLSEVRIRLDSAKAKMAELDLAERAATLVESGAVEAQLVEVFARCRTKLLAVPSRVRQADPALTVRQLTLVEELIREALEDLTLDGAHAKVASV
jgi:phage terminase Nu1 subunit (DNA packaging protein)